MIAEDKEVGEELQELLQEHLDEMRVITPEERVHALDLDSLRGDEVTCFCAWSGDRLAGCGALKALDNASAEIKSMRTSRDFRRQGVAQRVLDHLIEVAKARGVKTLYLETGSTEHFKAAQELYYKNGFRRCGPFAGYGDDHHSLFMMLEL